MEDSNQHAHVDDPQMNTNESNQGTCIRDKRSGNSKTYRRVIRNKGKFKVNVVPYAEIGASLNNSRFGLLLWGGCFCCYRVEFGRTQNIVSR